MTMARKRYDISFYTSGKPFLFESDIGLYSKGQAERFVRRYNLALRRLAIANPPTTDARCRREVLQTVAEGRGHVPAGDAILERIFRCEGYDD
jgi:hypothetical protein